MREAMLPFIDNLDFFGNTVIDHSICFGGAKCRDVCPWGIPQRQASVGIYLKLALRHPLWYTQIKGNLN
jgi:Fe-S-cluster-containing dehydrogenase component